MARGWECVALRIGPSETPSTKCTQGVRTKTDFSHKQFSIRRYYMLFEILHQREGSNLLFSEQGAKRFIAENHLLVLGILQILLLSQGLLHIPFP